MTNSYHGERWKTLQFDFEFTNEGRIEVSNFGRIRTFNKISDGRILNGSMINGYRIIRLKLYSLRDEAAEKRFANIQQQITKLTQKNSPLRQSIKIKKKKDQQFLKDKKAVHEAMELIASLKKNLSKKYQQDLKDRTIHYHTLVHRAVAEYFLKPPSPNHTVVAHLDYDKLNNHISNLKWMTPEENYTHQQNSPHVINKKAAKTGGIRKLTVTRVMLLKKLLNEGRPIKTLVKQFKVTDTQILRIKRGENWTDIKAAE